MTEPPVDLPLLVRALLALAAVLVLLLAGRWVLVRRGIVSVAPLRSVDGLRVAETLALDGRHRLVVIRRGEAELLLAIGPHGVSRIDVLPPPATIANAVTSVP